jgi:hypothetical protein
MRRSGAFSVSWSVLLLGLATVAGAEPVSPQQSASPSSSPAYVPMSPDQEREVTTWLTAMEKWQRYDAKWRNRPARDAWGRIAPRKPPPSAPEWLEAHCASADAVAVVDVDARTKKACRLLADARASTESMPSAVQAAETPPKHTSFWTRVHLDGLWTTTSTGTRLYGLVGTHVSLVDIGRVQIFGPPGVMLLSVPDGRGGRRVELGYTWGVSVRLMDMRLGRPTKNVTLFLNVSKVWVGGGIEGSGKSPGFDIAGFSIAPYKKR